MNEIDQILKSEKLPSLPQVALRVIQIAKQPEPDFESAAEILQTDPALSAQLLRTANSILFGTRGKTSTVHEALCKLGMNLVRSIALSFYLAPQRSHGADWDQALQAYWWRSLSQACAAEEFGFKTAPAHASKFFLGGLLQDIGILSLLHTKFDRYKSTLHLPTDAERREFEDTVFGFNHLYLSERMFRNWGLEDSLVEGMQAHSVPLQPNSLDSHSGLRIALRTASLVSERMFAPNWEELVEEDVVTEYDALLQGYYGYSVDEIAGMVDDIEKRVQEIANGFNINIGPFPSNEEILSNANQLLGEFAIKSMLQGEHPDISLRDPLTGLYNRRKLDQVNVEPDANTNAVGVLFIDIDKFKDINDSLGHQFGDGAIKMVANVLEESVRDGDFVFRYGGDEFVVVLRSVCPSLVTKIADRIAEKLGEACNRLDGGGKITLSIGGAFEELPSLELRSDDMITTLIQKADNAMYEAKRQGGDQVCFSQPVSN